MTNREWLNNLSDEDWMNFIHEDVYLMAYCSYLREDIECCTKGCGECILKWLRSEREERNEQGKAD